MQLPLCNRSTDTDIRSTESNTDQGHFVKLFTSVSQQHTVSLSQRHDDNRQYLWLYGERMVLLYYHKRQLESLSDLISGHSTLVVAVGVRALHQHHGELQHKWALITHSPQKHKTQNTVCDQNTAYLLIKRQAITL